jgi:hypothetical protein
MSIEITPELQEKLDLFGNLSNITNVVFDTVPDRWKDQINNIDSVLFKIYKNQSYIDFVVPKLICYSAISEEFKKEIEFGSFDLLINRLIDNRSFDNSQMESFYYYNAQTGFIDEIDNVISKNERTPEQEKLIELFHTVEFVREVFLYEVVNNPDHILLSCNVVNSYYSGEPCPLGNIYCSPQGLTYKVLVPHSLCNDVNLHQNVINDFLKWYHDTAPTASSQVYSSEHQHNH